MMYKKLLVIMFVIVMVGLPIVSAGSVGDWIDARNPFSPVADEIGGAFTSLVESMQQIFWKGELLFWNLFFYILVLVFLALFLIMMYSPTKIYLNVFNNNQLFKKLFGELETGVHDTKRIFNAVGKPLLNVPLKIIGLGGKGVSKGYQIGMVKATGQTSILGAVQQKHKDQKVIRVRDEGRTYTEGKEDMRKFEAKIEKVKDRRQRREDRYGDLQEGRAYSEAQGVQKRDESREFGEQQYQERKTQSQIQSDIQRDEGRSYSEAQGVQKRDEGRSYSEAQGVQKRDEGRAYSEKQNLVKRDEGRAYSEAQGVQKRDESREFGEQQYQQRRIQSKQDTKEKWNEDRYIKMQDQEIRDEKSEQRYQEHYKQRREDRKADEGTGYRESKRFDKEGEFIGRSVSYKKERNVKSDQELANQYAEEDVEKERKMQGKEVKQKYREEVKKRKYQENIKS